jgi:hypothetical protein
VSYYRCRTCAGRFIQEFGQPVKVADDAEWQQWVGPEVPGARIITD